MASTSLGSQVYVIKGMENNRSMAPGDIIRERHTVTPAVEATVNVTLNNINDVEYANAVLLVNTNSVYLLKYAFTASTKALVFTFSGNLAAADTVVIVAEGTYNSSSAPGV